MLLILQIFSGWQKSTLLKRMSCFCGSKLLDLRFLPFQWYTHVRHYSFMEAARIRNSVVLPREVAKSTVIEDNGEKVPVKTGELIHCDLVSHCPILSIVFPPMVFSDRDQHRRPQARILRYSPIPNRSSWIVK